VVKFSGGRVGEEDEGGKKGPDRSCSFKLVFMGQEEKSGRKNTAILCQVGGKHTGGVGGERIGAVPELARFVEVLSVGGQAPGQGEKKKKIGKICWLSSSRELERKTLVS